MTIVAKKNMETHFRMNITKNSFFNLRFYIHKSIPFKVYVQKNLFATFPRFWFSRYCRFRRFFGKRDLYKNFLAVNFGHTYIPTNGNLHLSLFNIEIFYCLLIFFWYLAFSLNTFKDYSNSLKNAKFSNELCLYLC